MLQFIMQLLFGCRHRGDLMWPRKDREGYYQRCCECGARIEYEGGLCLSDEPETRSGFDTVVRDEPWRAGR